MIGKRFHFVSPAPFYRCCLDAEGFFTFSLDNEYHIGV